MAISAAAITRKSSGGTMTRRYGSFAGKTGTEAAGGVLGMIPPWKKRRLIETGYI